MDLYNRGGGDDLLPLLFVLVAPFRSRGGERGQCERAKRAIGVHLCDRGGEWRRLFGLFFVCIALEAAYRLYSRHLCAVIKFDT